MNRIAQFYKVSEKRFVTDWEEIFSSRSLRDDEVPPEAKQMRERISTELSPAQIYREIQVPVRATKGSAGYDFFAPVSFMLAPGQEILLPTGICCRIDDGWMLQMVPRSGLGYKYRLQLNNTVGIIDSDYFEADNEGHIKVKLTNDSKKGDWVSVAAGNAMTQGIFVQYGITMDDASAGVRKGGFGSTSRK